MVTARRVMSACTRIQRSEESNVQITKEDSVNWVRRISSDLQIYISWFHIV